jgi:hypothetical protein
MKQGNLKNPSCRESERLRLEQDRILFLNASAFFVWPWEK